MALQHQVGQSESSRTPLARDDAIWNSTIDVSLHDLYLTGASSPGSEWTKVFVRGGQFGLNGDLNQGTPGQSIVLWQKYTDDRNPITNLWLQQSPSGSSCVVGSGLNG